jgi:hypothetical protein
MHLAYRHCATTYCDIILIGNVFGMEQETLCVLSLVLLLVSLNLLHLYSYSVTYLSLGKKANRLVRQARMKPKIYEKKISVFICSSRCILFVILYVFFEIICLV